MGKVKLALTDSKPVPGQSLGNIAIISDISWSFDIKNTETGDSCHALAATFDNYYEKSKVVKAISIDDSCTYLVELPGNEMLVVQVTN